MPSCMRAPPDVHTMSSASPSCVAYSMSRVSFSPTTLPMLPPM